ncbi:MAG: hypothetical protein HYX68_27285 [Planctomycetes bacterium]|nr:hypothetical protein [Planctomycetota bacterium]
MKNNAVVSTMKTKQPPAVAAPNGYRGGWREHMELALKGLVDDSATEQLDTMYKLLSDPINELRDKLQGHADTVTKLASRLGELARTMEQSKVEEARQADELAKLGESIRAEAKRQGEQMTSAVQEQAHRIGAVDDKFAVVGVLRERLNVAEAGVESQGQRLDALVGEIGELRQLQECTGAAAKELAAQLAQMRAMLTQVRADLAALAAQHDTTTCALAELKSRQEQLESNPWTAGLKRWCRAIWSLVGKSNKVTPGATAEPIV